MSEHLFINSRTPEITKGEHEEAIQQECLGRSSKGFSHCASEEHWVTTKSSSPGNPQENLLLRKFCGECPWMCGTTGQSMLSELVWSIVDIRLSLGIRPPGKVASQFQITAVSFDFPTKISQWEDYSCWQIWMPPFSWAPGPHPARHGTYSIEYFKTVWLD